MNLLNKDILFISVRTFDYEKYIINKLKELGANVTFFDDRPSNSIFIKGLIRINKNLLSYKIDTYFKKIQKKCIDKKYDYLFVIKGETIPEFFLSDFKYSHPNCKMIYYTWDSFTNNPNALRNLKYFDKKITFDRLDSISYKIQFRPLFYLDKYAELRKNIPITNKILFIGSAHSDRYIISQNITHWSISNNIPYSNYYYIPNIFVFYFKYLFDKTFSNFSVKSLSFKSLTLDEILRKYCESTIILDINHPNQSGLTMRTFEALGSCRKLITTNKYISDYPFYNSNNILIIERNQKEFPIEFFITKFADYEESFYIESSLYGWLNFIFSDI